MKKYILIILILFIGCSKDTVFSDDVVDPIVVVVPKCDCKENLIQVTLSGSLITQSSLNVLIDCSDNGLIFNKKYNGTRLIQYTIYLCN